MPTIANLPAEMVTEHVNWHVNVGNPGAGGRAIQEMAPGSGEEFLVWHKGFIERFHDWVGTLPSNEKPNANAISPWTEIPQMLKMSMNGWNPSRAAQETQLQDWSNFSSLDDLGMFLEWGLHGWLHFASSTMFGETVLLSFESPKSTYFWQLHGLIDHWRAEYEKANSSIHDIFRRMRPELLEMFPLHPWPKPVLPPRPPWPLPDPWPPVPPRPPWDPRVADRLRLDRRIERMDLSAREVEIINLLRANLG